MECMLLLLLRDDGFGRGQQNVTPSTFFLCIWHTSSLVQTCCCFCKTTDLDVGNGTCDPVHVLSRDLAYKQPCVNRSERFGRFVLRLQAKVRHIIARYKDCTFHGASNPFLRFDVAVSGSAVSAGAPEGSLTFVASK